MNWKLFQAAVISMSLGVFMAFMNLLEYIQLNLKRKERKQTQAILVT